MTTGAHDSPIDAYLDALLVALRSTAPRHARQLLAEAEAHLRDAADDAVAAGMTRADAEADAVRRFGPVGGVAAAEQARRPATVGAVVRQCVASGWFLGAVGAIAVGISGAIAAVLGVVGGDRFLADNPGRLLSPADCTRWLALAPSASNCHQAAITDWAGETVFYRIAFGLVGLAALAVFVVARGRLSRRGRWIALPATVVDTVAVTAFGASGVWLLGMGLDAVLHASGHGAGQWLSAAPVSLAAAAFFGFRLLRDLRSAPGPNPDAGALVVA
ncbi:MAG TPA: permease prefix domain 1-containing protein [Acidimicrobiales bacterium]|jgi:hypothetical protein|nr:permease prefix domain 1-containing protein [Acidimicrobiales bacterium]